MLIAILSDHVDTTNRINQWLNQYCNLYGVVPSIIEFSSSEEYMEVRKTVKPDMVFICLRGDEGFLYARRIREEDPDTHMVFIGDTTEYAVKCVRLHFTDYMVQPLDFKSFVRAMKLSGVG